VARDRTIVLYAVAVICAAVVATAGLIAWVGLVIPHLAGMLFGPEHRNPTAGGVMPCPSCDILPAILHGVMLPVVT